MADRAAYVNQFNCQKIDGVNTELQAGRTGRPFSFDCTTNVRVGGWFNAAKAQLTFGTTGRAQGMASAFNAEIKLPDWNITSAGGVYTALEVNYNFQANTVLPSNVNYPQAMASFKVVGTQTQIDEWEDNCAGACAFYFDGLTATNGSVLDTRGPAAADAGLKIMIGTQPYWIMLSTTGD